MRRKLLDGAGKHREEMYDALDYADRAADAARGVEAYLRDAVAAFFLRDLKGVLDALEDASHIEREWGDDPATQELTRKLLR